MQTSVARERLVFTQTVEALFVRGVAGRLSPSALQRLKEGGLDLGRPMLPAYTAEVFTRCIAILAEELCPGSPETPPITSSDSGRSSGWRRPWSVGRRWRWRGWLGRCGHSRPFQKV
jgi:hypothetical protein